ncbi:hypothetical protein PIB30_028369 [Stylosanthes scabra]|uniref:Glycosyltransferase n=1 Tax=Stylosanthes scabra TaxID=79078 RepID=A0ABU6SBR1_9FABA|nr:hypothetical protein [Stylosanthes scabra]
MDLDHQNNEGHIVMLPFMAHGHLNPFLALAKQILKTTTNNFKITIATTPLNIQYLKSSIIANQQQQNLLELHLAELPFNCVQHDLPPNIENTENLPLSDVFKFIIATTMALENPFHSLISKITEEEGHPPLCIISDIFFGWVTNVAKSFGSKSIIFFTGSAFGVLAYTSILFHLPHRNTDSEEFWVPGFPQKFKFKRSHLHRQIRESDGNDAWSRFFVPQLQLSLKSDGWIGNTVEEIEPLGLDLLRKYIQIPVWCVGPLLQPLAHKGKESGIAIEECIEWLNVKDQSSVLYISFGSQNTISASQMMALAEGLEQSERSFIWVIRPPFGFDINGEFNAHEWLPKGFEERIKNTQKGLLVHQWGPQMKILSHKSIAAFLSHCGWNSVLESLSYGVPIIGWPLAAEQAHNAKMLEEELGVGVILTATVESVVSGEEVKNVIEMVLNQESVKGKEMKVKAKEIEVLMREAKTHDGEVVKGSSLKAIDDFGKAILQNPKLHGKF